MNTQVNENGQAAVEVTVTVNNKPVCLTGPRVTGIEVKNAAIAQGVAIDPGFVLSLQQANGKSKIVGDNDVVTINKNSIFKAIANDDNS